MPKIDWPQLAAQEFQLSSGAEALTLLPAAFRLLASPNPDRRDGLAYPAIATWLESGLLDEHLDAVARQTIALLAAPRVYTRSFAALILAEVLSRDAQVRQLSGQQLHQCIGAWAEWYTGETDLRSRTPKLGWLHALAHGADVAAVLSRHPGLSAADLQGVLETLLRRIETVAVLPVQFEEDRLGMAIFLLLVRPELTRTGREHWLEQLGTLTQPTWGEPRRPAQAFAVQVARALLMFTHYGAKLPGGTVIPAPAPEVLQQPLLAALKTAFAFAYPE